MASQFKKLRFANLPNAAHYTFCKKVNVCLSSATAVIQTAVGPLKTEFSGWFLKEHALIEWVHKSELTARIAEADHALDRILTGLNERARSEMHSPIPANAASGGRLHIMFKNYGYVIRKPYDNQKGDAQAILDQLNGAYNVDVKQLGLEDWVDELNIALTLFIDLLEQRGRYFLQKPEETFKEVRRAIEIIYHQVVVIIDANAILNIQPDFGLFIDTLNPDIERLNMEFHRIRHDISHAEPEPIPQQSYTEQPVTPTPNVYYVTTSDGTVKLELGKDYNVSYKNNINVGNAQCIIHGKGAYKGSKIVTFIIAR
jgi:hypothetical protein